MIDSLPNLMCLSHYQLLPQLHLRVFILLQLHIFYCALEDGKTRAKYEKLYTKGILDKIFVSANGHINY